MAYEFSEELPWRLIAERGAMAEEALARLDQRLADSDLKDAWIQRAHFQETCAAFWLEGEIVSLEDLVLHDAETAATLPSRALFQARAVLLSRRAIGRATPAETLSLEGILALQERRRQVEFPEGCEELVDFDPDWDEAGQIAVWLKSLRQLEALPALPAAALALKAWHDLEPLQHASATIGRLLIPVYLCLRGKLQEPSLCLNLGLRQRSWIYNPAQSLEGWMVDFFEAVAEAAKVGLKEHSRLVLAEELIARKAQGHRRNSRLPKLGQLLLESPLVSAPMAAKALGMSQQKAAILLEELTAAGVREMTGRSRYRAYGIL